MTAAFVPISIHEKLRQLCNKQAEHIALLEARLNCLDPSWVSKPLDEIVVRTIDNGYVCTVRLVGRYISLLLLSANKVSYPGIGYEPSKVYVMGLEGTLFNYVYEVSPGKRSDPMWADLTNVAILRVLEDPDVVLPP